MRIIDIPAAVPVMQHNPDGTNAGKKDETFQHFLVGAIDTHKEFGHGITKVRQGVKIHAAVMEANGVLRLEDADYDMLKAAVEGCPWMPRYARECITFFDALENAQQLKVPIENK